MFEAIHLESRKLVSSFKLTHDLEWQGKERDEFIAPSWTGDWEEYALKTGEKEVKVGFVKRFTRKKEGKEEIVREHFRVISEKAQEYLYNESEEHKLAKEEIYDNIEDIKILNLNNKLISEIGEISDVRIEKGLTYKRADVLVEFKDRHPDLGRGIAFEVQISPQNNKETIVRSFDRAADGFSVVWLWSEDIRPFKNVVKVIPYKIALSEYSQQLTELEDKRLSDIALKTKYKIQEVEEKLRAPIREELAKLMSLKETIDKTINSRHIEISSLDITISEIKEQIGNISGDSFTKYKERLEKEFENTYQNIIKESRNRILNEIKRQIEEINYGNMIKDLLMQEIKKLDIIGTIVDETSICPRCSGKMHEYVDGVKVCFDCPIRRTKEGVYYGNTTKG